MSRTTGTVRTLGEEALTQLPRLIRLDQVRPRTRISLGKLLDEQAEEHPDQVFFLFEDRAHTHAAAKHRIDSIVRGLISVGIHQGEHVGRVDGAAAHGADGRCRPQPARCGGGPVAP